ncbi:MAG TPA: lipocalin-like domain-containing protein [Opitutaceae bacterium]|nr:lipocalin-like domain-containing protein [Opitutaceae bacterium]
MKSDAAPGPAVERKIQIIGLWRLESRIDMDSVGKRRLDPVLGADPLGILCFSADRFAAQFMRRDRSQTSPPLPAGGGANNSSAVNGYDAYFGTYTLDEATGALRTQLEGAITPANIGSVFERQIEVVGDKLVIKLATTSADGAAITRTLTFVRLP